VSALALLVLLASIEPTPEPPEPEPPPPAVVLPADTPPEPTDEPAAPAPDYPLNLPAARDFQEPGDPFRLVDLRYRFFDFRSATHELGARLKVGDRGYVSAALEGERGTFEATSDRLALRVGETNGVYDLFASYRMRRLLASAEARRLSVPGGRGGWLLTPALALRLSPELEILGSATADTRSPHDHARRFASAGVLWQRGAALEVSAGYEHRRISTTAGFENGVRSPFLAFVAQLGPSELSGDGRIDDTSGRFPRTEYESALRARVRVTSRLLAFGSARGRFENDLRSHEYRAGVTWHGRRFYLPRSSPAAARAAALARRALELGWNERRVFDDDGIRAQRERLGLSPHRDALEADLADLYDAQVDARAVPLLGLEAEDSGDALPGVSRRALRVFVGVPWPLALPWNASEASVPFLRLDATRERTKTGASHVATAHRLALTASLNREMELVVRWSRAQSTLFELIRGFGIQHTAEVSFVYAFAR
jgi:hypothetical protein